jgi:hypothetical protein
MLSSFGRVSFGQNPPPPPIIGRWDIVVHDPKGEYPSWLEVSPSGYKTLVGRFVGHFGSARPISEVTYRKGQVRFALPVQWEGRKDEGLRFSGRYTNGQLSGTTTTDDGRLVRWTATRAPKLKRWKEPVWGDPIELFNGRDLQGWKARNPKSKNGWIVQNGLLINKTPGNDLVTTRKFTDFQLHAEFRYPKGSNSGIYLRGRYEAQIEDNYGLEPQSDHIGGIYGFLIPRIQAAKRPGEWQTYDITLVGRTVTIALNGETVIDRQEIPGITGGALDSREGQPGPLFIQGDHGTVAFRKITITPAR